MKDTLTLERPGAPRGGASQSDLRIRLRDFYDDYCTALDEDELERWPDFFTEDCTYKAISRENYDLGLPIGTIDCDGIGMVRDRVMALRSSSVYEGRSLRHFVSGLRIRGTDPDGSLRTQINYVVFEALPYRDPQLFNVGRFIDVIVPQDDGFLFREHIAVYDNYRILTSLVMPL